VSLLRRTDRNVGLGALVSSASRTQYREHSARVVLLIVQANGVRFRVRSSRATEGLKGLTQGGAIARSPSTRSASRHRLGELCALARAFEQGGLDGPAQAAAIPNSSLPVKRLRLQVHVIPPLRLIGSRLAGHRRCEVIGCFLIGRDTRR
jgi:hypothetical protein